jgi:hypothetical protein
VGVIDGSASDCISDIERLFRNLLLAPRSVVAVDGRVEGGALNMVRACILRPDRRFVRGRSETVCECTDNDARWSSGGADAPGAWSSRRL